MGVSHDRRRIRRAQGHDSERLYQAISTLLKAMSAITLMPRPCRTKPSVPITPMLQL